MSPGAPAQCWSLFIRLRGPGLVSDHTQTHAGDIMRAGNSIGRRGEGMAEGGGNEGVLEMGVKGSREE